MEIPFVTKAVVRLTPKELVKRHMSDPQHTISDEEWKQLQVGIFDSENNLFKTGKKAASIHSSTLTVSTKANYTWGFGGKAKATASCSK